MRKVLLSCLSFCCMIIIAKGQNFSYTPEKPKPGETITITYTPAGDIANTMKPVEAVIYTNGQKISRKDDLALNKKGTAYTATITADTAASLLFLGFSADEKYDNNFNEGYWIPLYVNDKPRSSAYFQLASFYQFRGSQVGLDRNNEKALTAMEKELDLYPDNKRTYLFSYYRLFNLVKKDEAPVRIQKEIESILKGGLKEENDYSDLENLYSILKLTEQSKLMAQLKKEKFPDGKWLVNETIDKLYSEKDLAKKEAILNTIKEKIKTDKNWESQKEDLPFFEALIPMSLIQSKDWTTIKTKTAALTDKERQAQIYNSAAWEMQKSNDNLALAEEFSRFATTYTKAEWQTPTATKPEYFTKKEWDKQRAFMYAMYADTYGMIMHKMGNDKKGLPYAKEAALTINKGKDPDQNNTYALLAEKVLPAKKVKKELEQFVKDGKATGDMKDILQRIYVKEKGSETGFNDYIAVLQKENQLKMLEELRKSMLSEKAPSFALLDMNGKKLDIAELRGKVVVVDFWATWCGPCKASFPGMQKMVNKYKDNNDVKFIFVDTWEQGDAKEKNAAEFIASNKYSFHVLMDNDNKVVEQFKVEGIPTKFILDKNGLIRFKAVGFDGSDDKLMSELTAMIEMATEASTQKGF